MVAAVLLGEQPSWGGWAGILMISGGVLLLAVDRPRTGKAHVGPILIALLNAAVIVAYSLADATGARRSGHAFGYTAWMLTISCVLFVGLALPGRSRRIAAGLQRGLGKALVERDEIAQPAHAVIGPADRIDAEPHRHGRSLRG